MIRLLINKRFYSYERIIFPEGAVRSDADVIRYMRFFRKPDDVSAEKWDTYRTPVIDLTESIETIRGRYSKELRYEVRRAEREEISYRVITDPDDAFLAELEKNYFEFCDSIDHKELKSNFDIEEISQMSRLGQVLVTKAEFEDGWAYHVYQADGNAAMLWFSIKKGNNKSLVGWANRGLHDFDISYLKGRGFSIYDFGNIASEDAPNSIDKFKMSFGGELKTAYCCFVGNTMKGRALIALRNIKNGLSSDR